MASTLDGISFGAGAGIVHGLAVALWSGVGAAPSVSGVMGVALLAVLVASPVGAALGAIFGAAFGLVALTRAPHLAWFEAAVVALIGGAALVLAIVGHGGATSGLLAWTAGPLLIGTPAAALHGRRSQRRTASR